MAIFQHSLAALDVNSEGLYYQHPDYVYYKQDWSIIRDCVAGERRMKAKGPTYLPPLSGDDTDGYTAFLERAVFTNMTARTLAGLVGQVFAKKMKVTGVKPKTAKLLEDITPEHWSFNVFGKWITKEVIEVGRVGVLVDRPSDGGEPYMTYFLAENIINWKDRFENGKRKLTYVHLREIVENSIEYGGDSQNVLHNYNNYRFLKTRYRVLKLDENGDYIQELYETLPTQNTTQTMAQLTQTIRPTKNGLPLKEIPFYVIGPNSVSLSVQKSPLIDIANLNLAHYRTSGALEHGRYFTALPVYYVSMSPSDTNGEAEYTLGPSRVWETPAGSKPGILEYYGTGLSALVKSLDEKELAIQKLGGAISQPGVTQNAEVHQSQRMAESAILLNVTESVSLGLTMALRFLLDWNDNTDTKTAIVALNQDFKLTDLDSREVRAISMLYEKGLLPVDEVYRIFQESNYISEDTTLEQFKAMLKDTSQFPNQPDAKARKAGYANVQQQLSEEQHESQILSDQNLMQMQLESQEEQTAIKAKEAEKARKQAAADKEQSDAVNAAKEADVRRKTQQPD